MVDNIVYSELQLWLALSSTGDNRLIEIEDTAQVTDQFRLLVLYTPDRVGSGVIDRRLCTGGASCQILRSWLSLLGVIVVRPAEDLSTRRPTTGGSLYPKAVTCHHQSTSTENNKNNQAGQL